ncbi:hypothetical protein MC885_009624 [Smutsia gigantea]|nr:hypothetical protein MC885_009624 [Smutsia gigantea]
MEDKVTREALSTRSLTWIYSFASRASSDMGAQHILLQRYGRTSHIGHSRPVQKGADLPSLPLQPIADCDYTSSSVSHWTDGDRSMGCEGGREGSPVCAVCTKADPAPRQLS